MKYIYSILASVVVLTACGEDKKQSIQSVIDTGNITEIRAKKKEIEANQKTIQIQLDSLSNAIARLDTSKKLPLVTTLLVQPTVFNHYIEVQGNVSTKKNVLVYPEMPGILKNVYVKEGQYVRKGAVLAELSDSGISEQIAQLETQSKLAKTTFERQERLWEQQIGSEIEYLKAETNYQATLNGLAQAKEQLEKSKIRAPFNGTIDEIFKEQGTVVAPGMGAEIFRVINLSKMYVDADIPESHVKNIQIGKKVAVDIPVLGKTVNAIVQQVGSFINPNNRTFNIEIGIQNPTKEIKPNMTAKLQINDYTNETAILIPQSIISENAKGEQYIYTVGAKNKNGEAVAKRTIIRTGKTQGDVIEIFNEFGTGVEIIDEGARSVTNGQTVKVLQ
ncbi:MAG: efflux RND transporter periplasmic adaptor subunit [Flavicella sp.]